MRRGDAALGYLARSPGLYGGHVAESHGDYYAKCAPPPPKPSHHRFLADRSRRHEGVGRGLAFARGTRLRVVRERLQVHAPKRHHGGLHRGGLARGWSLARALNGLRARITDGGSASSPSTSAWPTAAAAHFPSGRGVLACPKTELERNILKWLWWHPGAYGWVGNYRGTAASDAFDGKGAAPAPWATARRLVAGDARSPASLGFVPDNGGECAIEERCAVLVGNGWVIEKETWGKGESWEVTDRWKTGDITWYGDYIDDKSCGTGKYALPEKDVDENDSGELVEINCVTPASKCTRQFFTKPVISRR